MKLRIARKIIYGPRPVFTTTQRDCAYRRLDKFQKNNPHSLMFKKTMTLAEMVKTHGAANLKTQAAWKQLRTSLCNEWQPRSWGSNSHHTYEWGVHVFNTEYSENSNDIIMLNLEYYSDRWCYWRIAVMDCAFKQAVS